MMCQERVDGLTNKVCFSPEGFTTTNSTQSAPLLPAIWAAAMAVLAKDGLVKLWRSCCLFLFQHSFRRFVYSLSFRWLNSKKH